MKLAAPLSLLMVTTASAGIVGGQVDDFEEGTAQGWGNPTDTSGLMLGGPSGAGDTYLNVFTNFNTSGPGSTPAVFNTDQWAGDYIASGVDEISMDLANFTTVHADPTTLNLRLMIFTGFGSIFTTTATVDLANDGAWGTYSFDISEGGVTLVDGGIDYETAMTDVTRLLIRHQPGAPAGINGAPPFPVGNFGVDNITALPTPGGVAILGMATLLSARRRRA